jgi:hypothetical protein
MLPEIFQIENYTRFYYQITDRYVFKIPPEILTDRLIIRFFPTFGTQDYSGTLVYSVKIPGFGTYSQESYEVPSSLPNNERFINLEVNTNLPISLEFTCPAGVKQARLEVFCFNSNIELPDFYPSSPFSDVNSTDRPNRQQPIDDDCLEESEIMRYQHQPKPSTYQQTKEARDRFTIDPAAPSCLFVADAQRDQLIFKSPDTSTARFKVIAFDRTHGYPAELGTVYADINNELFDEIQPGGTLVVDGNLAKSDIYVFASIDLAKINITITELK